MKEAVATGTTHTLASALSRVLAQLFEQSVTIVGLRRLSGGASHETWAFDALTDVPHATPRALILRRDFEQPLLDGDPAAEFTLLQRLHAAGLPVPRPLWCTVDATPLGAPAMIVERVDGRDLRKVLAADGAGSRRRELGETIVAVQAGIHRCDGGRLLDAAGALAPPPSSTVELARWARPIEALAHARPLLSAALAWLRAHPPAAGSGGLVHGDFKANNLVFAADGSITVIDWEMAHAGDAVEDLAWTLLWTTHDDLVGGLLSRAEYLTTYARISGSAIDPERLFFWELFALVKLAAIFVAGGARAAAPRPMHLMLHRALPWIETRLATKLAQTLDAAVLA